MKAERLTTEVERPAVKLERPTPKVEHPIEVWNTSAFILQTPVKFQLLSLRVHQNVILLRA